MQPYDYTMNVIDPLQSMQSGMQVGMGLGQAKQDLLAGQQNMDLAASQEQRAATMFDQGQQDRQAAMAAEAEAKAGAKAFQTDMFALSEKVTAGTAGYKDFSALMMKYPDATTELKAIFDGMSAEEKDVTSAGLGKAITAINMGRPDLAITMMEERAAAATNSGDKQTADMTLAMIEIVKSDPSAAVAALGAYLSVSDPELAKTVLGEGAKDKSVQSTIGYVNGTTVVVYDDGTKGVSDAAGTVLEGQEAIDAVTEANRIEAETRGANAGAAQEGKLDVIIDKGAEAAASEEAGKQAIAKSGEAFDNLNKVRSNMTTIDTAVAALDAGANSGAVAKYFPDVTAASASLANAMNRLGLDVIGSVTFGALSEAEMKLAMETAVPRNLGEADLRAWLLSKKAAQEKAAEALTKAAIYLGTPGNTLAGWLSSQPARPTDPPVDGSGSPVVTDQVQLTPELDALMTKGKGP